MQHLNHLSDDPDLQRTMHIEFLINWVNQFQSYPHCAQALDLTDFQSGIIFCELVYDIILQRKGGSFLSKVITSDLNQQRCIQNIALALQQINDPNLRLTPQQVYAETDLLVELIEYLQSVDKNLSNNDKPLQQSNQLYQQGVQQNKKPPLPNKMKLSGTQQEHKYNISNSSNMNQYVSPQFGVRNQKGSSGVGDELLEPDNESDAAYMDNPYEIGGSQDNTFLQSNNSFQNPGPGIPSNRSSQQNNRGSINEQKLKQYEEVGPSSHSNRNSNLQQGYYEMGGSDQQVESPSAINIENIQKMSQSLSEYFKKQNSAKNSNNNFFNIQEDGHPVNVDNEQDIDGTPSEYRKGSRNQKNNEGFDQSARNTSSQTKFYQMNKMRPGEKPFQAQIIELPGEMTQQDRLKHYEIEHDKGQKEYPNQLPSDDYSNNNSFSQIPTQPIKSNLFEDTQPRQLNSVPIKEPSKFTPSKANKIPMTMKDMAALSQPKQPQIKNQVYYQDVKNILNNKYGEEDNQNNQYQQNQQNQKLINVGKEQNKGVNYYQQQQKQMKPDPLTYNNQIQGVTYQGSQSFNCSPQQKNSFIIDKFTNNKQCSERKIKQAQEFLQSDVKEEKVNLKKILQGGVNFSRISNKGDPLSATSNGIVLDIEIETVSDKTRSKLLSWLNEIKLLKSVPNLDQKLHRICKDGIIFADIINLMEGKTQIIKGLERKPKKDAQITANYLKIFNYLRNSDKMNPRYLSQQFLIQQNENIFWGFLDDLWYFYHNKISPHDVRYNGNQGSVMIQQNNNNNNSYSMLNTNKQQNQQLQQQQKNNTNTSHLSTSQAALSNSQRRSNSQIPPNNLKQIQEEEDSRQQSLHQQAQDFLGEATVTSNQSRRRQFENYEDIIHDNHNETKRKRSNQRSHKENSSINQGYIPSQDQNMNELLTEDNFYQNQNIYANNDPKSQYLQQVRQQPGSKSSPSSNPILATAQNTDVEVIKNWLRNLGFSHMLRKSERLHEQYMKLKEEQGQDDKQKSRNSLRKKNPNDKLWGTYTQEEEKIIIQDPLKNGILLCLILSRIEMCRVDQVYRQPENIEQCHKNYDLAYRNIRARTVFVPIELLWRQKDIFQGQIDLFWQVCHGLMVSTSNSYTSSYFDGQENIIPQSTNQAHHINQQPSYLQNFSSHKITSHATTTGQIQTTTQNYFTSSNSSMIPNTFTNHAQQHLNPQQQLSSIPLTGTASVMHSNSQNQLSINMQLPYSEESLNKLKNNLIEWVDNMGIFAELNVECNDFETFLSLCRDGAVLCYIMCHAFNIKIVGINRKSCTKGTALSNIRKFLEIFKRTKDLPNIFFVTEESIYDQKEHLIIYLLEELMRYQDKIPSRQPNSLFEEPYLKVFPQRECAYPIKGNTEYSMHSTANSQQQNQPSQNPYFAKGSNNQPFESKPSIHNQSNRDLLKNKNENFLNQSHLPNQQNITENQKNSQKLNTSQSGGLNSSKSPTNQQLNQGAIKIQEQSQILQNKQSNFQIDDPYSIIPSSKRIDSLELNTVTSPINMQVLQGLNQQQQLTQTQRIDQVIQKNKDKNINVQSPLKTEGDPSVFNDFGGSDADQDSLNIKAWLSTIGFEDLAYSLNFQDQILYQFKDGTVLCKILEKLESKFMKGINSAPKTTAHCKFNLKKCLEVLEKKSEMAQELLWDEDQIYDCNSEYMKQLLLAIRYAYRKATKSLKRSSGSSVFSQITQR